MKSKLFTYTQGLDIPFTDNAPDQLSVCLRMSRSAYIHIAKQAQKLGLTTGEYVDALARGDKDRLSREQRMQSGRELVRMRE